MPGNIKYEVSAGGAEPAGWIKQSTGFGQHLKKQGCAVGIHLRPGLNHYSIMQEFEDSSGYTPQLVSQHLSMG
jgi:arylformamidase